MKTKRIFALVLSVLLVVAMIPAMAFAEEPAGTSADNIVILATNDVHCAVDTGIGYVNLAAYKEQLKNTNKNVTQVEAGDANQGEANQESMTHLSKYISMNRYKGMGSDFEISTRENLI